MRRLFHQPEFAKLKLEAFRFLVVGGANFLLTLCIFYGLLKIMHAHHLVALIISWAFGIVFSYALNFAWVFRPEEKVVFKQRFARYFTANLVSVGLNMIALELLVRSTGYDAFWIQFSLIPLIVVFNFSTAKFWSLGPSIKS